VKVRLTKNPERLIAMAKTLPEWDAGYVGVTYVPVASFETYFKEFAASAIQLGDKANVEHILDRLAGQGGVIDMRDISGSWWTEIDTPEDLSKARDIILKRLS
jgi:choline kinase